MGVHSQKIIHKKKNKSVALKSLSKSIEKVLLWFDS